MTARLRPAQASRVPRRACLAVSVVLVGALAAACGGAGATSGQVGLTVFAAASLRDAVERAADAYEAGHPETAIVISTGSSAALATQIEQGAPADVFLAADTANPQRLVDAGLADGDALAFAGNELTVIVPHGNPGGIAAPSDVAAPGIRIIAAGDEVPISRYAGELVANLAALPGYPPDFAAACAANVVSREDDVRAVIAKIELGEGDAAIVYATDVAASGEVDAIPVPAGANVEATYAGVVVAASDDPAAAGAFLAWLAGPDGAAILAELGFLPPPR